MPSSASRVCIASRGAPLCLRYALRASRACYAMEAAAASLALTRRFLARLLELMPGLLRPYMMVRKQPCSQWPRALPFLTLLLADPSVGLARGSPFSHSSAFLDSDKRRTRLCLWLRLCGSSSSSPRLVAQAFDTFILINMSWETRPCKFVSEYQEIGSKRTRIEAFQMTQTLIPVQ